MKKRTLLKGIACCMFCLLGCFASYSSYATLVNQSDGKDILINPRPVIPGGMPRSPETIPFFAELESGYVLLGSLSSCGIVDVSLTSTAGDDFSTVFDTANGAIVIPISGYTGDYVLIITTSAGTEYIGEFSI